MIFVTVGVQLPFDRLIKAMDSWASRTGRCDIEAQVGAATYDCKHIRARAYLQPAEFQALVEGADLVVAHAGMGSIITALELGKRIIVMPRQAALSEHRNDHQFSTARHLSEHGMIEVARDETELHSLLDRRQQLASATTMSAHAGSELIERLKTTIRQMPRRSRLSRMLSIGRLSDP